MYCLTTVRHRRNKTQGQEFHINIRSRQSCKASVAKHIRTPRLNFDSGTNIMKGLPTSPRSSNCFGNRKRASILTRVRCIFKGPPRATEYPSHNEKPYRHVPTHAASDYIKTTTSPAMRRAEAAAQVQPSTIEIELEEG